MNAAKENFLFRGYFKRKQKEAEKLKEERAAEKLKENNAVKVSEEQKDKK
jgi:phospholipid/cholesterol/gamma-HCH transport system substrate-binding protein